MVCSMLFAVFICFISDTAHGSSGSDAAGGVIGCISLLMMSVALRQLQNLLKCSF